MVNVLTLALHIEVEHLGKSEIAYSAVCAGRAVCGGRGDEAWVRELGLPVAGVNFWGGYFLCGYMRCMDVCGF